MSELFKRDLLTNLLELFLHVTPTPLVIQILQVC
uniref:Uncharacterized protein n=1 Tax=Anguilla anguilla TaxID=7936 RepID=A0A0E9QPC6_ANGAN